MTDEEREARRLQREMLAERARIKREFGRVYREVGAILFRADPMGLNFGENSNEYEPEVGTILPRLRSCASGEDVLTVIVEEFVRWFGPEENNRDRYLRIAEEIWEAWQRSDLRG